ncbi:hypothetical protein [Micromonospora ureilytica]|uniref:hypothetical protein n=1 Tax=Micromonospora ureilytica TaxID=709868 RepID=UPI002E15445B|nr:hypothetical protein OHB55_19860 [Micromonospora ureilytica]
MKITEETPGQLVAILEMPVTPADLTELAAQLPADVVCTHIEPDGDSVYTTWERHQIIPVD